MTKEETILGISENPLLTGVTRVQDSVACFKESAKHWYFQVVLSPYSCLECGDPLQMTGVSEACCASGHVLDPSVSFQVSDCCGARLLRRNTHYGCSGCSRVVASRFLFDERILDAAYFAERARESRERKRRKVEELRQLLAGTRSGRLNLDDISDLDAIPGLSADLDAFIGGVEAIDWRAFLAGERYDMQAHWHAIGRAVRSGSVMFSRIPPVLGDARVDRVWRFRTLVHMWHEREVELTQYGNDLLVEAL